MILAQLVNAAGGVQKLNAATLRTAQHMNSVNSITQTAAGVTGTANVSNSSSGAGGGGGGGGIIVQQQSSQQQTQHQQNIIGGGAQPATITVSTGTGTVGNAQSNQAIQLVGTIQQGGRVQVVGTKQIGGNRQIITQRQIGGSTLKISTTTPINGK